MELTADPNPEIDVTTVASPDQDELTKLKEKYEQAKAYNEYLIVSTRVLEKRLKEAEAQLPDPENAKDRYWGKDGSFQKGFEVELKKRLEFLHQENIKTLKLQNYAEMMKRDMYWEEQIAKLQAQLREAKKEK